MLGLTLSRHVLAQDHARADFRGDLPALMAQVSYASKIIAREMRRAALVGELGLVGDRNATGDAQKKLDVFANDMFVEAFRDSRLVAAMVSEELEDVTHFSGGGEARYILCTDPLDGSSNTDINGSLGTIFGFFRRRSAGASATPAEILRRGEEMVLAGYVLYSTSTVLVYSCGQGLDGFTLDHDIGEYLLSHENISCPRRGKCFSANLGHLADWHKDVQSFVRHLTELDASTGRPYSLRYSGALVGDVHRCLIEGGLYFYPADSGHKNGKLRLLYECGPLAYIVEQAGGSATTGAQRILDVLPDSIHQRVPFAIGSVEDVALYEKFLSGAAASAR